jgi:hypothetical protein
MLLNIISIFYCDLYVYSIDFTKWAASRLWKIKTKIPRAKVANKNRVAL